MERAYNLQIMNSFSPPTICHNLSVISHIYSSFLIPYTQAAPAAHKKPFSRPFQESVLSAHSPLKHFIWQRAWLSASLEPHETTRITHHHPIMSKYVAQPSSSSRIATHCPCRLHARDLWQFLLWHCRPPHGRCLLWWIVNMTTRHLCATSHWWLWKRATAAILL